VLTASGLVCISGISGCQNWLGSLHRSSNTKQLQLGSEAGLVVALVQSIIVQLASPTSYRSELLAVLFLCCVCIGVADAQVGADGPSFG
jgi:hypothetical protein